jgi:hypothetical protein
MKLDHCKATTKTTGKALPVGTTRNFLSKFNAGRKFF